ncbi:MAG TPA: PAS domain S-box protein [Solirubrobacteraceae bacterium]|nr:PAS domain S-box protein [Solirubrobacteraceae bacterium]
MTVTLPWQRLSRRRQDRRDAGARTHAAEAATQTGTDAEAEAEVQRLVRELAAAEERQRMLLRSLPDTLVALYDLELRCLILDGPMAGRGGFAAEDYLGRPIKETLPPDQYEQLEPLIRAALAGHSCSTEWTSLTSAVTYQVDIAPYRLADGMIAGAFAVARDVAERNARNRALADSERLLAEAQALAHIGSWEFDASGERVIWSAELCRISGLPIGTTPTVAEVLAMVHPDDRERLVNEAGNTAGGQTSCSEYRWIRPDGEVRYLFTTRFARTDGSGRTTHLYGSTQDVTERVQRERELRYLAAIVEQSGEAITSKDASGNFTEWNSGAERLYGYSANEAIGRPVSLILPEHRSNEARELLERALAGETVEQFETERRRKDGTTIDVSITVSPVRDPQGRPIGASIVTRDVSKRRQAERDRDAALERFEAAFDHAPIGMAVADTAGRIVRVNEAFSWITGYPAEELDAKTALTLVHPDDLEHVKRETAPLEDGADTVTYEHRMEHAAGHLIWVQVSVTIMRDPAGTPLHALVQMLDVSEQRLYEDDLQRLADHDPLTGLFNRRGFEAALDAHLARCQRYGAAGAVLMLDLDGFKAVNDTLGHAAGDEIIKSTAEALSSRLRQSDMVARLGGDEFAVLLPTQTQAEAEAVAQALLETVRKRVTPSPDGEPGLVSASVGVAPLAEGELRAGIVLGNADLAMYAAKAAGKGCYRVHSVGPAPASLASAG